MGMRDELNAALAEAFDDADGLADAVRPFAGSRPGDAGEYVPGVGYPPAVPVEYTGRGIFADYSAREVDGTIIMSTDQKLTALQIEVTETPKVGDTIHGKRVQHVAQDAVGATWVLQLRVS